MRTPYAALARFSRGGNAGMEATHASRACRPWPRQLRRGRRRYAGQRDHLIGNTKEEAGLGLDR